jgi:hypothetical protein
MDDNAQRTEWSAGARAYQSKPSARYRCSVGIEKRKRGMLDGNKGPFACGTIAPFAIFGAVTNDSPQQLPLRHPIRDLRPFAFCLNDMTHVRATRCVSRYFQSPQICAL